MSEKAVLLALADAANGHTGRCHPRIETIALQVEANEKTVRRALTALEEKGFIKRHRARDNEGRLGVYSYTFALDFEAHPPDTESASPPDTESALSSLEPEEDLEPSAVANATAAPDGVDVQALVGEFVDMARAQDAEPPKRVIGMMARELKSLSAEASTGELRAAMARLLERGLHPSSLASVLFDVRQRGSTNGHDPLSEMLAAHDGKWPTGSRLVRGAGGAAYVQDPLGYDTPPHAVRWGRPTRTEVLTALRRKDGPG